jgi:hypothetical protein
MTVRLLSSSQYVDLTGTPSSGSAGNRTPRAVAGGGNSNNVIDLTGISSSGSSRGSKRSPFQPTRNLRRTPPDSGSSVLDIVYPPEDYNPIARNRRARRGNSSANAPMVQVRDTRSSSLRRRK